MSCASLEDLGFAAEYGVPGMVWGPAVRCLGGIVRFGGAEACSGRQWIEVRGLVLSLLELAYATLRPHSSALDRQGSWSALSAVRSSPQHLSWVPSYTRPLTCAVPLHSSSRHVAISKSELHRCLQLRTIRIYPPKTQHNHVSLEHRSPPRCPHRWRRYHRLHPHRIHSLNCRRRHRRSIVHSRRPAHPEPQRVWRRVCSSCFDYSGRQLDPPRHQVGQAAAHWVEPVGYVWVVHFWHCVPEGKREDLRLHRALHYD